MSGEEAQEQRVQHMYKRGSIANHVDMGRVAFIVLKRKERGNSGQVMRGREISGGRLSILH